MVSLVVSFHYISVDMLTMCSSVYIRMYECVQSAMSTAAQLRNSSVCGLFCVHLLYC